MTPLQWMNAWHRAWRRAVAQCKRHILCPCATDPEDIAENARIRRAMRYELRYLMACVRVAVEGRRVFIDSASPGTASGA